MCNENSQLIRLLNQPNTAAAEIWATHAASQYRVSTFARVRRPSGTFVTPHLDKTGTPIIIFRNNNRYHAKSLARLVLETFLLGADQSYIVNTINRNRQDARLCNLQPVWQ